MAREDFPGLIPRPIMLYSLLLPLPVPLIRSLCLHTWLRAKAFVPTHVFFQRLTILLLFPTWR
ncbi:hypothetical protein LB505_000118 [Fusarium chuoi]|nr:hypothetical protein LB505_000118 [Fusarium chuoi]